LRLACGRLPPKGSRAGNRVCAPSRRGPSRPPEGSRRPAGRRREGEGPAAPSGSVSGQIAILEEEEREEERRSTVQHAAAQRRENVADPGDHGPGGDRRSGVEQLKRGQDPGEELGHEVDELLAVLGRRHQHRAEVAQEEDHDADDQVDEHRQPGRERHADRRQDRDLEEAQHQARQNLEHLAQPHAALQRPGRLAEVVGDLVPDPAGEQPAQDHVEHQHPHQDAQELADDELAAVDRLGEQRDGGLALDLLGHRRAGRQERQQHAEERDRGQSGVLVHLDVFAEREVRHEDRADQQRGGEEGDDEEGRLADRFLGRREGDERIEGRDQGRGTDEGGSVTGSVADAEFFQRRFADGERRRVDVADEAPQVGPDRLDETVDLGPVPLGDHLDLAVGQVADPWRGRDSVRVVAGTVITPLARDLLKRRGIVVRLAGAADVAAAAKGEWAFAVEPGAGWLGALQRSFLEDSGLWRELEASVDAVVEWLSDGEGRGAIFVTTDGATAVWRACRAHGVRAAFANEPAAVHRATGPRGANLSGGDPAGKSIAWIKQLATAFRRAGAPRDLIAAEYEHEHQHERGTA
ncbi:hypothetical protein HK102_006169, partial [Quaeritorhiza haematococci]